MNWERLYRVGEMTMDRQTACTLESSKDDCLWREEQANHPQSLRIQRPWQLFFGRYHQDLKSGEKEKSLVAAASVGLRRIQSGLFKVCVLPFTLVSPPAAAPPSRHTWILG